MFTNLNFNVFSLSLILSAAFAFVLAGWIVRKRRSTFIWFSIMLGAAAWWAMAYGFELACSNKQQMLMWIKVEYLGIAFLPSLWLIYTYSFIGRTNRLNGLVYISLFAYSALTYFLMATNKYHSLFYASTDIDISGPFPLLSIEPGPWYHVHTIVFYGLVIAGYWAMISHLKHTKAVFKKQNRLLIISTLIPLMVNFGYIFLGFRPYGHIDLTPFAFLLTTFIIAVGLLRFGLFDLSPMARTRVIQELPDGVAVLDTLGRLIDYNMAFEKIVQYDGELFGKTIKALLPKGKVAEDFPSLNEEGLNGYLMYLKDGRVFEVSANGLFEKSGLHTGNTLLFRDVSQRVESQMKLEEKTKQLEKLNSLKDRLFSIIAHDLRGPLLNLQETMNLLNAGVLSEEDKEHILALLSDQVGQSVDLMKNLLDWAESQQKGEQMKLDLIDSDAIFREAIEPLHALAEKKKQDLILNFTPQAEIYADQERIKIVLRNLVSNAIKFTPVGGKIELSTKKEEEHILFVIRDNGLGMTANQIKKVEKNLELESTEGTLQEKGSGLGLMLCRDFLKQHGSRLRLESQMGFGSTFSFALAQIPGKTHPSDPELYKYQ